MNQTQSSECSSLPNQQSTLLSLAQDALSSPHLDIKCHEVPAIVSLHQLNSHSQGNKELCLNKYLPKVLPLHLSGDNYKPRSCHNQRQGRRYQLRRR